MSKLAKIKKDAHTGHLTVAPYLSTTQTEANQQFLQNFRERFGDEVSPSVYSETTYSLVHFYADAARVAGQTDSASLLPTLSVAVFKAPGGDLSIDLDTNHFILRPQVGRSTANGHYEIVWSSPQSIHQDPYLLHMIAALANWPQHDRRRSE